MTIYKPNNPDRKQEKKPMVAPEVVVDDKQALTEKAGGTNMLLLVTRRPVTNMDVLRRRRRIRCAVIALLMLLVVAMALVVALLFNSGILNPSNKPYIGECDVTYHEFGDVARQEGIFKESYEVDAETGSYEKLEVPPLMDFRRSTVLHDFKQNITAIVDRENSKCYILPLDRNRVQPPKNFVDLIKKMKTGHYVPDATIVRESYRVIIPPMNDVETLGYQIWSDCHFYETYKLAKVTRPLALPRVVSKRSAECSMVGEGFCLGGISDQMTCISFTDCGI